MLMLGFGVQTNALTEVMFEDALRQARKLDGEFKRSGQPSGMLHGIPVTLKDQFNVKGYDTTLGYVGRSFQPAQEDAALVQILKSHGAIVIAKTNLPQSIMVSTSQLHTNFTYRIISEYSGAKPRIPYGA
jgi:amidase